MKFQPVVLKFYYIRFERWVIPEFDKVKIEDLYFVKLKIEDRKPQSLKLKTQNNKPAECCILFTCNSDSILS